jgi:rare lipoprotein A
MQKKGVGSIHAAAGRWLCVVVAGFIGGCGSFAPPQQDSGPSHPVDLSHVRDAEPRQEPRSKYGNPDSYVVHGKRYYVKQNSRGYVERGIASWYGRKFHGRRTSSGEPYDMYAMTAAHRTLPLPTYARVTNLRNHKSVVVKINDRGPFHENRIIDLSYAAATKLGIAQTGTGLVEVRALQPGQENDEATPSAAPRFAREPGPGAEPIPPAGSTRTASADDRPRLFLQAGAFISRRNAERLRERLHGTAGFPVRIDPVASERATVYRVRLGPIDSVSEADTASSRLRELGVKSQVVIEGAWATR